MIITKKGVRVGKGKEYVECECGAYVKPYKVKCHICGEVLGYYEDYNPVSMDNQRLEDGFQMLNEEY